MGGFLLLRLAVPVLVVGLLAGLLTGCDHEVDLAPPQASSAGGARGGQQAQEALDALVKAVRSGTREDAVALATSSSEGLLGAVHDNAAALRIGDLSMRYVDDGAPLDAGDQAAYGSSAWRGSVQLQFRYDGLDASPASIETSAVFVATTGGARIASFGGSGDRTPLWLEGPLSVTRTGQSLVAVANGPVGRYAGVVTGAVRQVRRVLPHWRGPLLVEVPGSRAELDSVLHAQPGEYDNIAAVTTTVDGSLAPGAPVRVFVNPDVFAKLKPRGAQVVMSHEATHVATGATFTSMPTWLLEGFADFVALDGTGIPVDVAAGQILGRIRKNGLPGGLPTSADLDPSATGLGATYEEAWLACRFLAGQYGRDRLVRFYFRVSGGVPAPQAFRTVLGTSQGAFVAHWRSDLARLARVAR